MQKTAKWEIHEIALYSGRDFSNPFTEVSVNALFSNHEKRIKAEGFYDGVQDGRHVWKVRFAPMDEGVWQYETFSNSDDLNGITGEFECVRPVSRGGLAINPRFANWFAREDGGAQMIANEGWYPHPSNGFELSHEDRDFQQPSEEDMKKYLTILNSHRVNMVIDIGQLYARQTSITDPSFRWPWKVIDAEHNKIDKEFFNLDFYRRMDRMMRFAKDKGIFFGMELLYDNSVVRPREWSHHPLNKANGGWLEGNENGTGWDVMFNLDNKEHVKYIRRYLRYTIARFSAYWNVFWSIGSENGNLIRLPQQILPFALFPAEKAARWYNYWGDFVAREDPYGRLRSYGDAGKQPLMVCTSYNNVIITQDPRDYPRDDVRDYYKAMNAFGEEFWHYGRPVIIGEMTASTNNHYETERRLYWVGFVSGYSMGRADRHFGPVVNGEFIESKKFNVSGIPPIYDDIGRLVDFVETQDVRFWRMRPNDELIKTYGDLVFCLAAEDEEYVLYFVNGGKAYLSLPACKYGWYNPRSGKVVSEGSKDEGCADFTAPDGEDWVLHIVASDRR